MQCPHCQHNYNKVTNSRDTRKEKVIWRRRQCLVCNEIFTTYESPDLSYLIVTKKNGSKERYSYAKLYAGIFQTIIWGKNVDKGDAAIETLNLVSKVQQNLVKLGKKNISTDEIKNAALEILSEEAPLVFLRYLSYVQKFGSTKSASNYVSKYS